MTYRVEVRSRVSDYLRGLEGLTREGRLAMYGFMNAFRDYGDEARAACPRQTPGSTVFRLRWTFDAGAQSAAWISTLMTRKARPRKVVSVHVLWIFPRLAANKGPGQGWRRKTN